MMTTKYYLALYADTFLWKNETNGLFYNSENHQLYLFACKGIIQDYCEKIHDPNNLYVIKVSETDWENLDLRNWLLEISEHKMGYLIDCTEVSFCPISFPPLLNLQSDVDRIDETDGRDVGEYAASNWNEFSIHIGGGHSINDFYKQFLYPVVSEKTLDMKKLKRFLSTADNSCLLQINVVGDISGYMHIEELVELLDGLKVKVAVYMLDTDLEKSMDMIRSLDETKYELKLYFTNCAMFDLSQQLLQTVNLPFSWIYLLTCDTDMEEFYGMQSLVEEGKLMPCPVYTGSNLDFFEQNIYTDIDEFFDCSYDKKDIFAHQVMNTNHWGRLTVLPDGTIYTDLNNPFIGTLDNEIYELIVKAMKSRDAWRLTRDYVPVCCDCLYRYLCPSPSNYEKVIGRSNLCHLEL